MDVRRQLYIDLVTKTMGTGLVVVLTGQRRVGKSHLLQSLRRDFEATSATNVIFIDKEKREFDAIVDYRALNEYIEAHRDDRPHTVVMIDEVQEISQFERSVRNYRTESGFDLIITGSNARMLSSELTTIIGGRYREIYIQPLSYPEFLAIHSLRDSDEALWQYITHGGMPGLERIGLSEAARQYLLDILNTALLKDVVIRNQIRNITFLENLVRFLADNTGKPFSAKRISDYITSHGEAISSTLVANYLSMLCEAYIIHKVRRFNIHGKQLLENNCKYYFEDHGIRNAIAGGSREGDIEKVLETIVFNHLRRMGYTVNVGELRVGEIDFVASRGGDIAYVQVSYLIADDSTREREFGNLLKINDNHPKFVVSLSPMFSPNDYKGVKHLHLRHFLNLSTLHQVL